jgi:hypothetical protein
VALSVCFGLTVATVTPTPRTTTNRKGDGMPVSANLDAVLDEEWENKSLEEIR